MPENPERVESSGRIVVATADRSTRVGLLGLMSLRRKSTGGTERERFIGHAEANKQLTQEYRKPWGAILARGELSAVV